MEKWVTRISRALMMGLAWGGAWVPVGVVGARLLVRELDPEHIGGPLYAGFICGLIFSAVAGFASGRSQLRELSLSRAAVSGVMSGLSASVLWLLLVLASGIGDAVFEPLPWFMIAIVCSAWVVMGGITAVGSVWIARQLEAPPRSSAHASASKQ